MRFLPKYNSDSTRIAVEVTDAGIVAMDYIADTNPHTGPYDCFIAQAAAVANITPQAADPAQRGATGGQVIGYPDLTAVVLAVGVPFKGNFSGIQLASGKVMAYRGQ